MRKRVTTFFGRLYDSSGEKKQIITDMDIIRCGEKSPKISPREIQICQIVFEISGVCNAGCPYCSAGQKKFAGVPSRFIPPEEFKKGLEYLYDSGMLTGNTPLVLYNWGEPLLHPNLKDILHILSEYQQSFRLSSNGSVSPGNLDLNLFGNISNMSFSLPGFSQQSYDRIHKLSFSTVLKNIDAWIDFLPSHSITINYFLYRFNYGEVFEACEYFKNRGVSFKVMHPYITDFYQAHEYLLGLMDKDEEKQIGEDLWLDFVKPFVQRKPEPWVCPLLKYQIVIDEYLNVVNCCWISKKSGYYKVGNLFSLDLPTITAHKVSNPICAGCNAVGGMYWFDHGNEWVPQYLVKHCTIQSKE